MANELIQTTLATGTTGENLVSDKQSLYNMEAAQQEGTQMELLLTVSPAAGSLVSAMANINAAAQHHGVLTWPGENDVAFASGSNQIALRWRKGQPWILLMIGILVATVVVWYYLSGWRFSKGNLVNVYTGQKETPSQFLSNQIPAALQNPSVYLLAAGMLGLGLFLWYEAKTQTSDVIRGARTEARAQRIRDRAGIAPPPPPPKRRTVRVRRKV